MVALHRTVLNRLLIAWLVISLVMGGGVLIYGIESIDDQIVDLATAESQKLTGASLPMLNRPDRDTGALERMAAEFVREHFIVVELYDRDHQQIVERVNPRHADIEAVLKLHVHTFPHDDQPHYEKFTVGNDTVLQVLVPLKDEAGHIAGFFEGVFLIDPDTIARLRREVAVALAVVLFTVLVTTAALYPVILALNRDVLHQSRALLKGNVELMEVLGSAIAKRDSGTNIHNYRVTLYAVRLAEAAGLDAETIRHLIAGAFLHDVGKIGIADAILLKPGRLDEAEFSAMKNHVALGVDILKKSEWLEQAREVVEFHHEKFDGSGYLKGLAGEAIPAAARVFAIADVFDALTSRRPYKMPIPLPEAMAIIRGDAGRHFDPKLAAVFETLIEPLHREIGAAADAEVEAKLWALIERYYLIPGSRPAAG
ncbi:MAG: HD domain-containing protein [Rhodocyclaceae bacterium]|nr:HD domain-containing protein [Rhodocyclaceae bacterium]